MTPTPHSQDNARDTPGDTAGQRGTDERRETVNPAENPAPRSPEPDREALEKGRETLERVKPY
jgi:hypothetical protein